MTNDLSFASARELLGPRGPFASALPGYEARAPQLEMAASVERCLGEERLLICEAGTGTGKTLAYLVPALLSGKRVVVSTATKALQEQIAYKDLPLIARALGIEPRATVVKGLANYLCKRRYHEFSKSPEASRPKHARALEVLSTWHQESSTGDVAELAAIAEDDAIWSHVTSSSETRVGAGCEYFSECFVTELRRQAEASQLLIVNHHLFFADLALRGPHPGSVLPDYDAVVFDEAHRLEDVASVFFGVRVSRARTDRLVRDLDRGFGVGVLAPAGRAVELLRGALEHFWEVLGTLAKGSQPRVTLERDAWVGPLEQAFFGLDQALEGVAAFLETPVAEEQPLKRELTELFGRRLVGLREDVSSIVDGASGRVTWLDTAPLALSSTPVDLSNILEERVFESIPAVVLTSATLATRQRAEAAAEQGAGPFGYLRRRLGLAPHLDVEELLLDSPFDFAQNSLLYTPRDLPPPGTSEFLEVAAERVAELVELTDGGAFVLTTSLRAMSGLHALLAKRLGSRRLFLQGQAPKQALISAFRAAGDAVLVATQSFWEGVDVPGHALRLVVLEKLPFFVPTDPIVRARSLAIERDGGNPFMDLFVPGAALSLKQGFGRLIRTQKDVGVVALLDERLHKKSYAKLLLSALPPAKTTDDFSVVQEFWERVRPTTA